MTVAVSAERVLFAGLIDDAGLYPPAAKPLALAAEDHARTRASADAWICDRFVCPVSRLDELAELTDVVPRIVAVCDGTGDDWAAVLARDLATIDASARAGDVEAVEARLPVGLDQAALREALDTAAELGCFSGRRQLALEVAASSDAAVAAGVAELARLSVPVHAKLRCGGLVASAFPTPELLLGFLRRSVEAELPVKLTAGLHHPMRVWDEAIGVFHHGFVNILAALALPELDGDRILRATDADEFAMSPTGLSWRGHEAGIESLARARATFRAFGSCSVEEPVELLRAQGLLA